jgi:hypothetical protein
MTRGINVIFTAYQFEVLHEALSMYRHSLDMALRKETNESYRQNIESRKVVCDEIAALINILEGDRR